MDSSTRYCAVLEPFKLAQTNTRFGQRFFKESNITTESTLADIVQEKLECDKNIFRVEVPKTSIRDGWQLNENLDENTAIVFMSLYNQARKETEIYKTIIRKNPEKGVLSSSSTDKIFTIPDGIAVLE